MIRNIMTEEVITVTEDDTVETCAKLLSEHHLSGLPVVTEDRFLKGIITEGDLIRRSTKVQTPAYLELLGGIIYLDDPNEFLEEVKKTMGLTAKDVMTEELVTIGPDEKISKAANLLVRKKIKRLPVIDDFGKLIGIVSRKDIMNHLFLEE